MLKKFFTLLALVCIYSAGNAHAELMQAYNYPGNRMKVTSPLSSVQNIYYNTDCEDVIGNYFKNFEILSKSEKWEEIIAQGSVVLEAARRANNHSDEAKICAQLTSTCFYMGNYDQALLYATRCHELAETFDDPALFIRALYLESAIYRALASKKKIEEGQQATYARTVEICEEAANIYSKMDVNNLNLKGKIYFNLGAAHADNPKGNLEKAEICYITAIDCFKHVNAIEDIIRTTMRLGKVYLLRNNYEQCQQIINEVRPLISSERLSMHADYLEAQLKFAVHDFEKALKIARIGLEKARILGAKEDESRLNSLLQKLDNVLNS